MNVRGTLIVLALMTGAGGLPSAAVEGPPKPHPAVHKNHVRRGSADYLGAYRRITWYYDFETAAELARETGRPMFVLFCRAGTVQDPLTGKPKCAS